VRTIRVESRGFERARHVVKRRRRDAAGRVEERVDSWDEASSGRGVSAAAAAASSFNRFRLR